MFFAANKNPDFEKSKWGTEISLLYEKNSTFGVITK